MENLEMSGNLTAFGEMSGNDQMTGVKSLAYLVY